MGVGLVEACLFDTRDSLLFESQIEGLATGSFPGGDGPCQGKRSSTREDKDILLAEDIGRDLLDFGNRITSPEVKKKLFTKANEDCNPPKRKKNDRHMLEKRIETVKAHAGNIKVTNTKTINSFKREYSITSSTSGRTRYVVKICCTPSCSCPDFRKNGKKVLCKHILFILMYILGVAENDNIIEKRYFSESDLSVILRKESNDFDPKFKYVVNRLSKVNKEEAKHILASHRLNNQPQKCILHYKENRSAKCYGRRCDVVFTKGSLCLKVTGALTIPLGKKEAVEQLFYFCGKKNCLLQKPVWCNVQYPTCIEACKTIVEQDRRKVAEEFELRIVDKCESDLIKLNSNGVTKTIL